jgi:hypothetical protein
MPVAVASAELDAIDSMHGNPARMRVTAGVAVMVGLLWVIGVAAGQGIAVVSPQLIEAAAARGSVRVMVQLKVSSGADAAEIAGAKQRLRSDLSGATYQILRDFPGLPAMVLDASSGALDALVASPAVARVTADEVRRPQR